MMNTLAEGAGSAGDGLSQAAPVRLVSCWDPAHADLVRIVLAAEEIRSWLGNEHFLSWFWHDGNAVGGVTVEVCGQDADHAREVLAEVEGGPPEGPTTRFCPRCRAGMPGSWDVCWRCGRTSDDTPRHSSLAGADSQPVNPHAERWIRRSFSALFALLAGTLITIEFVKCGAAALVIWGVWAILVCLLLRRFEHPRSAWPPGRTESSGVARLKVAGTRSAVSRAIVGRAWRAAVLAMAFPPLAFYSMRLLWKLDQRDTPLGRMDTVRVWAALILSTVMILYFLAFFVLPLAVLLSA